MRRVCATGFRRPGTWHGSGRCSSREISRFASHVVGHSPELPPFLLGDSRGLYCEAVGGARITSALVEGVCCRTQANAHSKQPAEADQRPIPGRDATRQNLLP